MHSALFDSEDEGMTAKIKQIHQYSFWLMEANKKVYRSQLEKVICFSNS